MSLLYYWGKPITKTFFQIQDGHQVLSFPKSITQVSSGEKHCVVVLGDSVIGFGDASEGQLGEVEEDDSQEIMSISLGNNNKVSYVSCGWNFTLLLDDAGTVYSSGRGENGELGRGKTGNFSSFSLVIKGARQISAGKDHSLALCGSKVMGWGNSK